MDRRADDNDTRIGGDYWNYTGGSRKLQGRYEDVRARDRWQMGRTSTLYNDKGAGLKRHECETNLCNHLRFAGHWLRLRLVLATNQVQNRSPTGSRLLPAWQMSVACYRLNNHLVLDYRGQYLGCRLHTNSIV